MSAVDNSSNDITNVKGFDLVGKILKEGEKDNVKIRSERRSSKDTITLKTIEEPSDKKSTSSKSGILTSTPSKIIMKNENKKLDAADTIFLYRDREVKKIQLRPLAAEVLELAGNTAIDNE